jgi:branched-chain amino acid transport system ATP-binding protein
MEVEATVLLETKGLTRYFGGLTAVGSLDMHVKEGEMVGLIGPNGAGKSTVFNLITGVIRPSIGRVVFDNKDITGMKPHRVARLGIGRTFQLNPLFGDFSVLQNVIASFYLHPKSSWRAAFFNTGIYRRNERQIVEEALGILDLLGLAEAKDVLAKNLPHGYQKMLGVARALATRPKLLLLDEPLGGMSPDEIDFAMGIIDKTRQQGITILLVEHNMQIMDIVDRVVVINFGMKICEGSIEEVRENRQVVEAYFGVEDPA